VKSEKAATGASGQGAETPIRREGEQVQRLFDAIIEKVLTGEFVPGQKLSEPELARQYGVSRGPVREAIRRLEERDLVQRSPNAGARIITHSPKEILDAHVIRASLESLAARLAAENMTDEEIVDLRRVFEAEVARGHTVAYANDFHMTIVLGSHNSRLIRLVNVDHYRLFKIWRCHYKWMQFGGAASWEDHRRVLEAIELRDGECAELLMRRHIMRLRVESEQRLLAFQATDGGRHGFAASTRQEQAASEERWAHADGANVL
jgi:DNA-binding GntR family transcriptional regulator